MMRTNICMLFADWEVCIVKNCDQGLEKSIFKFEFTIQTDPKLVNNFFFFPSSETKKKLTV